MIIDQGLIAEARAAIINDQVMGGSPVERAINTGLDTAASPNDMVFNMSFAEPTDVTTMLTYFNIDKDNLTENTVEMLKDIHSVAKRSSMEILDFLTETGIRVGGRLDSGFLTKVTAYLKAIRNEIDLANKMDLIKRERESYEFTNSNSV